MEDHGGHGLRLSQTALTMDAALSGQGVALVSRFLAERDIAANRLVQVVTETLSGKQDFYLLAERRSKHGASAKAVVEWFVSKGETDA
jgi:LysR family glycine cleavage system transcriptional activator